MCDVADDMAKMMTLDQAPVKNARVHKHKHCQTVRHDHKV